MLSCSKNASYRYFDIIMAFFVTVLVLSNIASSAKIVDLGFSLLGIRLAFDGGTLLFPLAYVLADILTEVYGFKASRRVIWTGFAALAFSALVFFVLQALPAESSWDAQSGTGITGSAAYGIILGGISSGGIVLASLAGYLVGEFFNSVLLSRIKVMMKGRLLWFRAVASSLVGELLDSVIFVFIACCAGVFGWELFITLALTNYILKCLIEALVLPVTYTVTRQLKKREGIDVYDVGVKYRPMG
ncbi:MAG: queuosine precursor transporter [Treponema sp.]|nr:queuosine precursor transporter [Treponema sp.]